jgi:hypothetical protein
MLLRILATKIVVAKLALTAAFTVGAVGGAAAVVGACAAGRALRQPAARGADTPAT